MGESVREPKLYFENNVAKGIALIVSLLQVGVRRFVFSSPLRELWRAGGAAHQRRLPAVADESLWMVQTVS